MHRYCGIEIVKRSIDSEHRAKKFLAIKAIREGFGEGGVWKWRLPSKEIKNLKEDHLPRVNAFENNKQFLLDSTQMHPAMLEGCKLSDILHHAIVLNWTQRKANLQIFR